MCSGGTIFPEGSALGSAWNPDLISRTYAAVAEEAWTPRRIVAGSDIAKTTALAWSMPSPLRMVRLEIIAPRTSGDVDFAIVPKKVGF